MEKGLPYISSLALENAHNLAALLKWNHDNGIHVFRHVQPALCMAVG